MSINFLQIFQESGYFVRNRYSVVVSFTVLYALNILVFQMIIEANGGLTQLQMTAENGSLSVIGISFLDLIISAILNMWFLLVIDKGSINRVFDIFSSFPMVFKKLLGFIGYTCLAVLAFLPIMIAVLTHMPFIISVLSLLVSGYLLVKVALLPFAYLFDDKQKGFLDLYRLVNSHHQYRTILMYLLLAYLVPMLFGSVLTRFLGADLLVVSVLLTSFIHLFSLIFSYRFYHLFIKSSSL